MRKINRLSDTASKLKLSDIVFLIKISVAWFKLSQYYFVSVFNHNSANRKKNFLFAIPDMTQVCRFLRVVIPQTFIYRSKL